MRLADFNIPKSVTNPETKLDIDSLMELFDGDFIQLQKNEMQAYFNFLEGQNIPGHILHPATLSFPGNQDAFYPSLLQSGSYIPENP